MNLDSSNAARHRSAWFLFVVCCAALAGGVQTAVLAEPAAVRGVDGLNLPPALTNPGPQANWDLSDYVQSVQAAGPVAYWRLGESSGATAADSAGTNPGSVIGGVTPGQTGALADGNAAMGFNGTNGYVRVANGAPLQLTGDLTIELWARVSLASRQTLITKDYLHEFELTLETTGRLNFYQGNGSVYEHVLSSFSAVTANTWQHVVVTRTAATKTIRFYVNGVSQGSGTYTATPTASAKVVAIGRSADGIQYTNGRLDEVALYPTALTAQQVATHFTLAASISAPTVIALQLTASDPDGDGLTFSASGLPDGLSVDPTTGLISGSLLPGSAGAYQVTAGVSDGALSDSQTFSWTITHVNFAPTLINPGNQASAENDTVSLQLAASDPGDALTYSATGLPASLSVDPSTGLIAGTLSFTSAGNYVVTAAVTDGSLSSSQTFTWTVANTDRPPALANPGDRTNWDLSGYAPAVRADGPAAYWRLGESTGTTAVDSAGANAATAFGGVTFGQPGALADGNAAMLFNGSTGYLQAANAPALQLAGDLTIELWANVSLATRQTALSKNYLREFEFTFETDGRLNLYQGNGTAYEGVHSTPGDFIANTWQHVVVTRVAATRTICFYVNGAAKGCGAFTITPGTGTNPVQIGRTATNGGVRYVNGMLDDVAIYPAALSAAQIAAHYALRTSAGGATVVSLPLVAGDPDGDGLTYSAAGLPAGLAVNPDTGLISGSLSQASVGVSQVTATVSDGILSNSQLFTWTVAHVANGAPTLINPGDQANAENATISLPLSANDPDSDALTFGASELPAGLTMNATTGVIAGTLSFSSAGSYVVTVTVSDGSLSSSQTFNWTVTNVNRAPTLLGPGNQVSWDATGYAQAVLGGGPVAYWRLGETAGTTAADSVGGNPGTVFGGVTLGQAGPLADGNPAMGFNGSSGYVRVNNSAPLPLAGDLTIELWVNVSLAARQTLVSKDYLREFELTLETSGKLTFYQGNGTTYQSTPSLVGAIVPNAWQHLVVTRTAATKTVRFYVNGVAQGSGAYTVTPAAGTKPVSIGRNADGIQYASGALDDVALYPVVLTSGQISAHYALRTSVGSPTVVSLPVGGSDPDGDVLTYSASGLPAGLAIDAATGVIYGTITASAGTYGVMLSASDGSLSADQWFTWTIAANLDTPLVATLTYPANGTTSIDQAQPASWTKIDAAQAYYVWIGTAPGTKDIIDSSETLLTSLPIAGLLPHGTTLYARMWTKAGGLWRYRDSTFTASPLVPVFVSPTDGALAVNPSTPFSWIPPANAAAHRVLVGTTPGANNVFDSGEIPATSVAVPGLPATGTLYARVMSSVGGIWKRTDSAFTLESLPPPPSMIAPMNGDVGFQTALPFEWSAMPLARAYRLTLGSAPGGTNLHDSGEIHVTRRFVPGLPLGTAYGRVSAKVGGQWVTSDFTFSVGANSLPDLRIKNALWATDVVRQMAPTDNRPFNWTLLAGTMGPRVTAVAGDFAGTLLQVLTEMNLQLSVQRLDVAFDQNGVDGHALVELFSPTINRWMLLDPTFDLSVRRTDTSWATAEDVSQATLAANWNSVVYVFLGGAGDAYVRSYYLDYPLLFANIYHQGQPLVPGQGLSMLPFLEPTSLPSNDAAQTFVIRCGSAGVVNATINGIPRDLPCTGVDFLTPAFIGTVADSIVYQGWCQLYRVPRYRF